MITSRIKTIILTAICIALLPAGCGYRVGSLLPADIKTIAVPMFENKTSEPELEIRVTNGIIQEFIVDGTLEVVEEGPADTLLIGEIIDYRREPIRYSNQDITTEYRLVIAVRIEFRDLRHDTTMWEYPRVQGEGTFYVEDSPLEMEQRIIPEVVRDLAHHVVEKVVEGGW